MQTNRKITKSTDDFLTRSQYCRLSESKDLWEYSLRRVLASRLYRMWERGVRYFRRFRIVTAVFRASPWILLAVTTDTLPYAVTAILLILFPALLLFVISIVGFAPLRYKKLNGQMASALADKRVFVLFPVHPGEWEPHSFFRANVRELAARPNSAVIVVSPFRMCTKGLAANEFYLHMRTEQPSIYLVRRHYFFSLRKKVLSKLPARVTLIY